MKYTSIAALIITGSIIVSACSVGRPRADIRNESLKIPTEHHAWRAARIRLHSMCPAVPKTEAELNHALKVKQANGCYVRFAKDTYLPTVDDWHWHWLPPYRIVAAVHDEELRKRAVPKLYEEYMSALNRYLAEKADSGEITPAQLRYVFNAGWNWLSVKRENERILLQDTVLTAANPDAATRSALSDVAGEMGTIATLALAVSAQDKRYEPTPAACYAHPGQEPSYTIRCY
jgi:hypothetical protein